MTKRMALSFALVACSIAMIPRAALYAGPKPGTWNSTEGELEFHVEPGGIVAFFDFTFYESGCGTYEIAQGDPIAVIDDKFNYADYEGYYFSGTFDSRTTARGFWGLDNYFLWWGCEYYLTRGPVAWTATCVDPDSEVLLNGTAFGAGSLFTATFVLARPIDIPFAAYAVVVLPDGSMLNALTLGPKLTPVTPYMARLDVPFEYPLLNLNVPSGAPKGNYSVKVGFFYRNGYWDEDMFMTVATPFTLN